MVGRNNGTHARSLMVALALFAPGGAEAIPIDTSEIIDFANAAATFVPDDVGAGIRAVTSAGDQAVADIIRMQPTAAATGAIQAADQAAGANGQVIDAFTQLTGGGQGGAGANGTGGAGADDPTGDPNDPDADPSAPTQPGDQASAGGAGADDPDPADNAEDAVGEVTEAEEGDEDAGETGLPTEDSGTGTAE